MLFSVAWFEAKHRILRLSTLVYFAVFFGLALLLMCLTGGAFESVASGFGGSGGKIFANSSYGIASLSGLLSYFGLLVAAPVMGQAVHQDLAAGTYPFFFTSRLHERDYLLGRYLGAFVALLVVFSSIGIGLFVGSHLPWLDKSFVGPSHLAFFIRPYLIVIVPNLLFGGALFFCLAALTGGMRVVYVTSVVLVVGIQIAGSLSTKIENQHLAALVNPFGGTAVQFVTKYWTVAEKNTLLIPFQGAIAENRLLWLGLGAALLAFTLVRFKFQQPSVSAARSQELAPSPPARASASLEAVPSEWHWPALLGQMAWLDFRETVKNVYFLVLVLAGLLLMVTSTLNLALLYGTTVWPVTGVVLEVISGDFALVILIIITLFSGELVFRERDARMDQLLDASPIPSWLPLLSKLLALIGIQVLLLSVMLLFGVGFQTLKGYHHYELGLYLRVLFGIQLFDYALLCVLAIAVQVLVNNKLLGYLVMVLYYLSSQFMGPALGFEHHLYNYDSAPNGIYSDMNGFGYFVPGMVWFRIYWALAAVGLVLLTRLFWVRGVDRGVGVRKRVARSRLSRRMAVALGVVLAAFAATGVYIFHNTNQLNRYVTEKDVERLRAEYEKRYKHYQNEPQPNVTDVRIRADLRPETQGVRWQGSYHLVNRGTAPVSRVLVRLDPDQQAQLHTFRLGQVIGPSETDAPLGVYTFVLPVPLLPGAESELVFDFDSQRRGFHNAERMGNRVYGNGTFVDNFSLPRIGYSDNFELTDDAARRKYGLAPKERMLDLDDPRGRERNALDGSDWVTFEATLTTSPDQIAIAPGDLVREWNEDGRRAFLYRSRGQMLDFYSVLSARYAVRRDRWKDVDIEVYFHPPHTFNIERMVEGVKATLAYATTNFGPYQHGQVRIVEFPRYATFAESFPSTIPFSESIGFIAHVNPSNEEDIDYPYYVTAHEVAHQWWAHQAIGADVQGASLLVESLAQYTALMVMKQRYGREKMRRFLKYELQGYLRGRGGERKKEVPLLRVENQPYIHYQKGSLVLYALQDAIGEDAVNRALARYLRAAYVKLPPYPNARLLLGELRKETPAEYQDFLTDLFETITLFDNRAVSAAAKEVEKGRWEVTLSVSGKKFRADELGVEHEVPMDQLVDIGVLGLKDEPLLLEKRRVKSGSQDFVFTVTGKPLKAGIDPLNILIDRVPDDNVVPVSLK